MDFLRLTTRVVCLEAVIMGEKILLTGALSMVGLAVYRILENRAEIQLLVIKPY
jgi:NADPH:quinone reductase-like Zn-dependent oxidoreductase